MAADDGDKATVKWLHAVRCVVAMVVTALAIAVTVTSIRIVLRPEELHLKIFGGTVQVYNNTASSKLIFYFQTILYNPSGRAIVSFSNVTATVLNGTSPPAPGAMLPPQNTILQFNLKVNLSAAQHTMEVTDTWARANFGEVNETYRNWLFAGNAIKAMIQLDGSVDTKVWLERGHRDTYYCYPLTVIMVRPKAAAKGDATAAVGAPDNDVFCFDNTPQRGWKK